MEFARYIGVQLLAYVVDMGGFIALTHMNVPPLWANGTSKVLAGLFAFLAHRAFTFEGSARHAASGQAIRYWILLALNVPLSSAVLAALLMVLDSPVWSKFVADALCVLLTYWLTRRFVFLNENAQDHPSHDKARG